MSAGASQTRNLIGRMSNLVGLGALKLAVLVLTMALLSSVAWAQTGKGSLRGTITDPSGAVVPNATVSIRNLENGQAYTSKASSAGVYVVPNVQPGEYQVTVQMAGFKKFVQSGVSVEIATITTLNITLQVGSVTQTVEVNANAPLLKATNSTISTNISRHFITNLPIPLQTVLRNPVQFLELVPGFEGSLGNDPTNNSNDQFRLNGGQENSTDILVDGVSISLASPNLQWNKGISTEAVSQFTVLRNNFEAEYGNSGDSIVTLSMKSGTNQLHGSGYDYVHNEALNSGGWLNNYLGQQRGMDRQHDFGFSIGGPVLLPHIYNGHNRTFFFFDYEGFRMDTASTGLSTTIPKAFEEGDFSALLPDTQLYDPTTHQPIPGNILTNDPNYKPSPVVQAIWKDWYPATINNNLYNNNVMQTGTSLDHGDVWDLKIDQNISDRQHVSGSYDWNNDREWGTSNWGPVWNADYPQQTRYARFSYSYIMTPTLFNMFNAGYTRRWRGELGGGIGQDWNAKLGIKGSPYPVGEHVLPCLNFTDAGEFPMPNCGDNEFADNIIQVDDGVTWVHGKHTMKFGGEYRGLEFNPSWMTDSGGEIYFDPAETSGPNGLGGFSLASADFGMVHSFSMPYPGDTGVRYKNFALYAQDSYKVTHRLTLNYGLRYDVNRPATEAYDRFSTVDPTLQNPGAGNLPGAMTYFGSGPGRNGRSRPQDTYYKAFGPRIGLAYALNNKTVIRAGYGIYYEPSKENGYAYSDDLGFFNTVNLEPGLGAPFQIDNGVPINVPPSGPFTPEGQNGNSGVNTVPRNSAVPGDMQDWNFDVQRQIGTNLLVDVAYVGSKGTHLPADNIMLNQVNPKWLSLGPELTMDISCLSDGTCPNAVAAGVHSPYSGFAGTIVQALRPFPQYGDFEPGGSGTFSPERDGNSTYHALEVEVKKRFSQGLTFLLNYTVSKDITNADSMSPGAGGFVGANTYIGQNSYNRKADKGLSNIDVPQNLVLSYVYQLPFGRGKRFLSHTRKFLSPVVSGWTISGIQTYTSGTPMAVYANCGSSASQVLFGGCEFTGLGYVNLVSGQPLLNNVNDSNWTTTPWFNPKAYSVPAAYTFGNEGRVLSTARTPGTVDEDMVLMKSFWLARNERVMMTLKGEFFNVFNRHKIQVPMGWDSGSNMSMPFAAAGSSSCPGTMPCNFGAVYPDGSRTGMISARITW